MVLGLSISHIGSSGTQLRNWPNWYLNVSTEQLVMLRIAEGKELNNLGPFTETDPSLIVLILTELLLLSGLTDTNLPLLIE